MTVPEIVCEQVLQPNPSAVRLDALVLQSAPALDTVTAVWVVLCFVGAVIGFVGGALARRLSNPVLKYRLLYLGVVFPYGLVAFGALALFDFGAAVRAVLGFGTGFVAALVAQFATALAAGVALLAAYGPTIRGLRAVRDIELTTVAALGQMARYVLGVAALLSAVIVALNRSGGGSGWLFVLVGFALLLYGASPWAVVALRTTRPPTAAETERLTRLRERAGLAVRDVRVLETGDADAPSAQVRGPPGYRRLFVSNAFLDRFDDETAATLLAVQAGRVRAHVLAWRIGTIVGAGVVLVVVFSAVGFFTAVAVCFVVLLVGLRLARYGVLRADEYAAERVGGETLVAAFERYATAHGMEPSRRRLPNPFSANVALGDRIDRCGEKRASSTD